MADQGNGLGVKMRPRIIDWRCFGSLRAAAQPLTIARQGNVSSSSEAAGLRPIPPRSCVLD